MSQLEILRESLGQCDEIILDALLMVSVYNDVV